MDTESIQQRRAALTGNIRETLKLIKAYEDKRRLADDPKEQRDAERQIADLRRLLEEYRAELAELEQKTSAQTTLWPPSIPDERYYKLPSRERIIEQLLNVLRSDGGAPAVVLQGLGGIGKTATAIELARRALRESHFAGLVGDSAKQEVLNGSQIVHVKEATLDFDQLLRTVAGQLGRWELNTVSLQERHAALTRSLKEDRYLVIVDNLETVENAEGLVQRLRTLLNGSRAIITSRQQVRSSFVRSVSLQGLNLEDTIGFLKTDAEHRAIPQILAASTDSFHEIHRYTGGAPLALKLIVGQAGFVDLDIVLRQLRRVSESSKLYRFIFMESWRRL